jgi:HAD superfamily hydrolase (TIGR01490 family)
MQKVLALFDFDGTITHKDSFIEFIKYYRGVPLMLFGFFVLSPVIILYKFRLVKNWKAKEIVISWFFKKEPYNVFREKCRIFGLTKIPGLVKPVAIEKIGRHIENGDRVLVVSASLDDYLLDWCESMNLELLATKLEVKNDCLTGKIKGKNCYGIEKKRRLIEYLDLSNFSDIFVYGDSKGDLPLMELANHKHFKSL